MIPDPLTVRGEEGIPGVALPLERRGDRRGLQLVGGSEPQASIGDVDDLASVRRDRHKVATPAGEVLVAPERDRHADNGNGCCRCEAPDGESTKRQCKNERDGGKHRALPDAGLADSCFSRTGDVSVPLSVSSISMLAIPMSGMRRFRSAAAGGVSFRLSGWCPQGECSRRWGAVEAGRVIALNPPSAKLGGERRASLL